MDVFVISGGEDFADCCHRSLVSESMEEQHYVARFDSSLDSFFDGPASLEADSVDYNICLMKTILFKLVNL